MAELKRVDAALEKLGAAITETGPTKYFLVSEGQLAGLERIAKRLYTEQRMDGNQMRDAAHGIMGLIDSARQLPSE